MTTATRAVICGEGEPCEMTSSAGALVLLQCGGVSGGVNTAEGVSTGAATEGGLRSLLVNNHLTGTAVKYVLSVEPLHTQ